MHLKRGNSRLPLLNLALLCAIVASTLFAFEGIQHHQFLNFDDNEYVTDNVHVKTGLNPENIRWAFAFNGVSYWHPLSWISHMLDCQLFGVAPGAHLLVNLALHILNAVFLFFIFFRMTGAPYKSALIAVLFALHPVNVESVSWVTERKTVLSTWLLLAAVYTYVLYAEKKRIWQYCLMSGLYILGLLSKPSILTLPFLLLVLDYWPLKRFEKGESSSGIILEKIPLLLLSFLSSYLSMASMAKFHIVIDYSRIPLDLRIFNIPVSIAKYLWNMVWPVPLSVFYPFPQSIPLGDLLVALFLIFGITASCLWMRKDHPWLAAGWLWFLVALSPASGLIQAGLWPAMANRFMYIPMIGIFAAIAWECDARITGRYSQLLKSILCITLLIYLASLTRVQNLYYSNSYALFTRANEVAGDNFVACNNIGNALNALNRHDEAARYFTEAIALNPKYDGAIYNYGLYLAKKGEDAGAMAHFSRVIELNSRFTAAYVNLAILHYHQGRVPEAENLLTKALEIDREDSYVHSNLGIIRADQGRMDEAIRHYRAAVKNNPDFIQARVNLSEAYEKAGFHQKAIAEYDALAKMMPENKAHIYYRMAGLYALLNKFGESERYLEGALKLGLDVFTSMASDARFDAFKKEAHYARLVSAFRH